MDELAVTLEVLEALAPNDARVAWRTWREWGDGCGSDEMQMLAAVTQMRAAREAAYQRAEHPRKQLKDLTPVDFATDPEEIKALSAPTFDYCEYRSRFG
jgi:hypothetical protein